MTYVAGSIHCQDESRHSLRGHRRSVGLGLLLSAYAVAGGTFASAGFASPASLAAIPQATETVADPPSDSAYTLGAGDRIRIDVFKLTQYSGEHQVLVDGSLNLPEVGNVNINGMTLKEASDAVASRFARILKYPIVTVSLLTPRPIKVGIAGEVTRPGAYTLPTTTDGSQLPTVTRALQMAGGITQLANLRDVKVRRPQRSGGDRLFSLNLWEFLTQGNLRQDITLRSGDTIIVPTAPTSNLAESVQISAASFAADKSQPLNIAIVGEVYRPGPYTVTSSARTGAAGETGQTSGGAERPPTITRAIQVAGGIKPQADIRNIQVRRLTKSGTEQTLSINLWQLLQAGDLNQDLILQDRDTVVIPIATEISPAEATQIAAASFSPDSIRVNVVGEVKQPGVVKVPPNTPLNQALLAAGGFNIRSRKKSVDLLRLNSNGTVTKRTVSIDFTRGLDESANPPLRNDDVVIVYRSGITALSDTLSTVVSPFSGLLTILGIFQTIQNAR